MVGAELGGGGGAAGGAGWACAISAVPLPVLEEPNRPRKSAAFSESQREGYHGRTVRTATQRYTEWAPLEGDDPVLTELYDLVNDPMEFNNLAGNQAQADVAEELSLRLHAGWREALPL